MEIPSAYKHIAFWTSVVVAGLNAAMALPDGAPTWRIVCAVLVAVLPLVFVKALHGENSAKIAVLQLNGNGKHSDVIQTEAKD